MNEMTTVSPMASESASALLVRVSALEVQSSEQIHRGRANLLFFLLQALIFLVAVMLAWLARLLGFSAANFAAVGLPVALGILIAGGSVTALATYQAMRANDRARRLLLRANELQEKIATRKPDPQPS